MIHKGRRRRRKLDLNFPICPSRIPLIPPRTAPSPISQALSTADRKMLCRSVSVGRKKKSGSVPVYLNVYDLTPMNVYAYWFGLGIYHSGVAVHGVEYAFGAHEHSSTGIFEVEPKKCPGFTYRKSILVGKTDMGPKEVRAFMEKLAEEYRGNKYNLIRRNCNHFCNDVCLKLTQKQIPSWVNRLARLGMLCNCVLPASLNEAKVRRVGRDPEAEKKKKHKKRLRSRSGPLSSSSSSSEKNHPSHIRSMSAGNTNPPPPRSSSSDGRQRLPRPPPASADPKDSNVGVKDLVRSV